MNKKLIHISRQALIALLALQILNLSLDCQPYQDDNDDEYDYSYAYNTPNDPTESAVEWIIELNCGQQPGFTYDIHTDTSKSLTKTFHWQTDLFPHVLPEPRLLVTNGLRPEEPDPRLQSRAAEILSPPPEI